MKKFTTLVLVCTIIFSVISFGGDATAAGMMQYDLRDMSLELYDKEKHGDFLIKNGKVDYVLKTQNENIPICLEEESLVKNVNIETIGTFAYHAQLEKYIGTGYSYDEYEFILLELDATFIYACYPKESFILILNPEKVTGITDYDAGLEVPVSPTLSNGVRKSGDNLFIKKLNYGVYYDLPHGIGARASTKTATSDDTFEAEVTTLYLNYSGSQPDVEPDMPNEISFYNYIGFDSYPSLQSDSGLMWSQTNKGWKPTFRLAQNGSVYTFNTNAQNAIPPILATANLTYSYVYKATPAYKTTLSISKVEPYGSGLKNSFTISGMRTNMQVGTTKILAGTGNANSSVKYKLCTTIARSTIENNDNDIKYNTRIESEFSNIKRGGSTYTITTSNADLHFDQGTIMQISPTLKWKAVKT